MHNINNPCIIQIAAQQNIINLGDNEMNTKETTNQVAGEVKETTTAAAVVVPANEAKQPDPAAKAKKEPKAKAEKAPKVKAEKPKKEEKPKREPAPRSNGYPDRRVGKVGSIGKTSWEFFDKIVDDQKEKGKTEIDLPTNEQCKSFAEQNGWKFVTVYTELHDWKRFCGFNPKLKRIERFAGLTVREVPKPVKEEKPKADKAKKEPKTKAEKLRKPPPK